MNNKKEIYVNKELLKICLEQKDNKTTLFTKDRASCIVPEFVGFTIGVYNGKKYNIFRIDEAMVGLKLGEFSPTRKIIEKPIQTKKVAAADKRKKPR